MSPQQVLMVGLGTIARTHLAVLGRRTDVTVVAGVDPDPSGEHPFPTYRTLDAALAVHEPDLVVVATPTATHVEVVGEVLRRTEARVLAEKPLARSVAELDALAAQLPADVLGGRVAVAHHFAFSPEVEWARTTVLAHPEWGRPTRIASVFNDAYGGKSPAQQGVYVSSWVDSGPNQLSLLAPFVDSWELVSHSDQRTRAVTVLDHAGDQEDGRGEGRTVLSSNWLAADTSKQTTLDFADGGQLRMDHTSMTGLVLRDGVPVEHAGYVGADARKDAHYRGLYEVLLTRPDDERLGVPLATEIARVLEATGRGSSDGAVGWTNLASC